MDWHWNRTGAGLRRIIADKDMGLAGAGPIFLMQAVRLLMIYMGSCDMMNVDPRPGDHRTVKS